jgi:ribonuclease G
MSTELIINASLPSETRIALLENGEIQDLIIERAQGRGVVGNIYKGRVTRVLPGMQAAFVDIGLEKAAFLYVDDVYTHSEIWEKEEGVPGSEAESDVDAPAGEGEPTAAAPVETGAPAQPAADAGASVGHEHSGGGAPAPGEELGLDEDEDFEDLHPGDEDEDDDDEDDEPAEMGPEGGDIPGGTVPPPSGGSGDAPSGGDSSGTGGASAGGGGDDARRRRGRRGGRYRRGGRDRDRDRGPRQGSGPAAGAGGDAPQEAAPGDTPEQFRDQISEEGDVESDRSEISASAEGNGAPTGEVTNRPEASQTGDRPRADAGGPKGRERPEFRQQRGRDKRIPAKERSKGPKTPVNIQDLLKEGQEVIVQVAKDPISTKGARLTCHISLPGRHLVCMPTIDHVGVSRRIERDEERRRLREHVERYRPKNLGFIVRTASGKNQSEQRIKQDIDYLTNLWTEIREKASNVTAPALVYEDLNSVLRAIRDWVTEEIDKIVVDSRYHFNDIQRFVAHFMPSLRQKVELYHGDVPIFDAYNVSTELARGLERKVFLKSGGSLVIDQAEALVAIDVNTGRFVGKKNLEDTILKTNLEAVQEIAYQLRLRNCGGIIILDLIDMEKEENKKRVYNALEEALKKDRARPSILKISELGLVEMTRKRTRDTMVRALCDSCPACEGKGFVKSRITVAFEIMREIEREGIERDVNKILVQAHPEVIDALAIDERETLDQIERRYRKQIFLQAVGDYHPEQFEVVGDKRERGSAAASVGRAGRERDRERERERGRGGRDRGRGGRDRGASSGGGGGGGGDRERGGGSGGGGGGDRDHRRNEQHSRGDHQRGAPHRGPQGAPAPSGPSAENPAPMPEFQNEEERLAYVRAQAAQDAALARTGGADGRGPNGAPGGGDRGDGPGGDGRRRRRGRRGGRRRRGGDRPRPEGGMSAGSGPREGGGDHGSSDGGGSGGSGDGGGSAPPSGGGGAPSGGGSDHPPHTS